ncbi:hypothetical protein K8352_16415 [Flavobacteriaceae bacterium F89]|uniref:Uncharacterized protein n=1 Tax=Cerina litoralis TaxID=2874477 RepID=A0AAE3JQP4_9FLAO|nr:hypothetical protein [Cerina litoralis]MCG2462346.1 hypothetical protein [Cerina litoralis]
MKAYLILFVAFIMLAKPLLPLVNYAMNYDYIVEQFCENKDRPQMHCDGKCYLAKQLAKESDQNDKNPLGQNTSKIEIGQIVFFQTLTHFDFGFAAYSAKPNKLDHVRVLVPVLFTSDISQPPELG